MKPATAAVGRLLVARGKDGLTDPECRAQLHMTSLAQRVHELRQAGWRIESILEQTGDGTRFARYYYHSAPNVERAFRPLTGVQEGLPL
jgi:hypothetical protein